MIGGMAIGGPSLKNDLAVSQVFFGRPQKVVLGEFFFHGNI